MHPLSRFFTYLAAAAIFVIYTIPMALILLNSLKSEEEAQTLSFDLPKQWRFDNYISVFTNPNNGVFQKLVNSATITVSVTIGCILVCSMAAYIIARRDTRPSRGVYRYLLIGMIAPFAFVPAIILLRSIGLYGTLPGLILVDIGIQVPFVTLLFVGFIKQLPRELDEAAMIDGAGHIRMFFQVIFPLLRPVTSTCVVILFTFAWNEFQNVLFLVPDPNLWTLPKLIYDAKSGEYSFKFAQLCATMVITVAPMVVVYLAAQRQLLSGMVTGAVKG